MGCAPCGGAGKHTNPKRQRGERLGTLAGASGMVHSQLNRKTLQVRSVFRDQNGWSGLLTSGSKARLTRILIALPWSIDCVDDILRLRLEIALQSRAGFE
jgi:hypothetical protein